jgi:hypothetical protein
MFPVAQFKGWDWPEFLLNLRPLSVGEEFLLVDPRPLDHEADRPRRQTAGEDREGADIDQSKVTRIFRMEMWWIVVVEERLDDYRRIY